MTRSSHARAVLLAVGVVLCAGCETIVPDLVQQRRFQRVERIDRLAIVAFYPSDRLNRDREGREVTAADAAALVTRFVTEALQKRVPVIPENDVRQSFVAQGQVIPLQAPELTALVVAREFGADAVLLGQVHRYREREGSAVGSMRPASVEFEVTLHAVPSGEKLWVGRFNQTQASLTANLFDTARLPGHGSRFLTVAELAQFGAQEVAAAMPLGR